MIILRSLLKKNKLMKIISLPPLKSFSETFLEKLLKIFLKKRKHSIDSDSDSDRDRDRDKGKDKENRQV